jgi:polyphosphate kinase
MDLFFNRELSALEFNARVLAEAMDAGNPLLERMKFMGIVSSNIDEFFMVRVASLKADKHPIETVRTRAHALMRTRNDYFLKTLLPEMEAAGLTRLRMETVSVSQREYLTSFFQKEVLPVLTPIALDSERTLPVLANLNIHLVVSLTDPAHKKTVRHAVVEVPQKGFPRMIFLPGEKGHPFVLLEDVIQAQAAELFPGYEIVESGFMRLTRGSELTLDEEKDEDFMHVMAQAIRKRSVGTVVRLEVSARQGWVNTLQQSLAVEPEDVVENAAWLDLKNASQIAFQPGFEALKRPIWEPRAVPELERADDLWDLLRKKSILLFHPYESFDGVINFLETAAKDPDVLAIKQTLYRTDRDSPILKALERAAENGKRVTAMIELKARFDEANNIEWAKRLMDAGASVLYGVAGFKTHAKACLVVRREVEGIRRYVHLGTGNYNSRTSRIYSDIGLMSGDDALAADVSAFFNMITGISQPIAWQKIEVAPYGLRNKLLRLIRRETMRSENAKPGIIRAKMNSLVDPELIEALYKASAAGVQIHLNVRGICCLKPGVKGLSETIHVVSIVDQFLEHSRIFHFSNGGADEVYLSSADWMPRNLDRRLELLFPIEDASNRKRVIETLDLYFKDNVKSWQLGPDGHYTRIDAAGRKKVHAQDALCQRAAEDEEHLRKSLPRELKPQKPKI